MMETDGMETDETGKTLQLLLHLHGADSAHGYENPFDMSEMLVGTPVQDLKELRSMIKRAGFALSPYTILHGGHVVDDLDFNDESEMHNGSLLAVPQDPIIRVYLPHRKRTLSVGRFNATVLELKQMLHEDVGARFDRLLIFGRNGQLLQDVSQLNSCDSFARYSSLRCRPQLDEYFNFVQPNERLSSVLKQAQDLQQDWCATGDFGNLPSKICEELTTLLTDALKTSQQRITKPPSLKASSYDRFVADFPTEEAPTMIGSVPLMKVKEDYVKAHSRNSKCPTEAKVAAETVITKFSSKNVKDADGVAECLQHLLSPITKLAAKDPMNHDHADRKRKIKQAEMALNRYRDIRAGKMYDKPEQYQDKLDAIQALHTEMRQIMQYFSEFYAEWETAKRWSDLTVFDRVEAESLKPATQTVTALVESAAKRVKEESERLEALRKLESDAAHHDLLIQNQVRWCKEVVKSAQDSTEEDIQDIDKRIRELLTERAAKELLRASLQQRMTSLDQQATAEAASFQRFKTQYAAKEAIVRERLEHAKLGSDVVKEFQQALAKLQATVVAEIQELRRKAQELRVDVAADCSEAYKVAHSVNYILKHYEEETLKSNEEEKVDQSKKYQMAMVQMRTDRAQEHKMQVDDIKVKIDDSLAKIRECTEAIASLDQRVVEPWAFVCQHGVGGPKPPLQTVRVVVRTSEANMAAWDGEDRALERPDEWNREMKAEADAFKNQLMLAFGD